VNEPVFASDFASNGNFGSFFDEDHETVFMEIFCCDSAATASAHAALPHKRRLCGKEKRLDATPLIYEENKIIFFLVFFFS
jgi:hypothetical protein